MASAAFSPDDIIALTGCGNADSIERCLLEACDREVNRPDGEPQDIELAFNCVRAVILRLNDNDAPEVQQYMAAAIFRRAQFLALFDRPEDARRDFRGAVRTWRGSADPDVRRVMAGILLEAGRFEENQENPAEAEKYYAEAEDYANDTDPVTQQDVVEALSNHADIYIRRGWLDPAAQKLEAIRARWHDHPEYWIRRRVANLLVSYAAGVQEDEGRLEEALPLFDDAIAYADGAVHPPAHFIQSRAWLGKCHCLERLERHEDAIACVESFEDRMTQTVRPDIGNENSQQATIERLFNRARMVKARCLNELGRHAEALEAFRASEIGISDLGDDADERRAVCNDLLLLVKILADLGEAKTAREVYDAIVARMLSFGKESIDPQAFASMSIMLTYLEEGADWFEKRVAAHSGGLPDPS